MKKLILSVLVTFVAAFAMMAFTNPKITGFNAPQEKATAVFPEDVQKVLETSCFDCHTDAASNSKAKMKLNFSKWSELSDSKKVGKMEGISEVIKSGDMPPGKYINNYPDKALSQEQKDLISKWVTDESAKLMGQ